MSATIRIDGQNYALPPPGWRLESRLVGEDSRVFIVNKSTGEKREAVLA